MNKLIVKVKEQIKLNVREPTIRLEADVFGGVPAGIGVEKYEGTYSVEPQPYTQTLPTSKKYLEENVVVKEIFYSEVSNLGGGNTVYIGKGD